MNKVLFVALLAPLVFLAGCWGKKSNEVVAPVAPTSEEAEMPSSTVSTESEEAPDAMAEDEK